MKTKELYYKIKEYLYSEKCEVSHELQGELEQAGINVFDLDVKMSYFVYDIAKAHSN